MQCPWEGRIRFVWSTTEGDFVQRKLSFLEGVAALASLFTAHKAVKNGHILIHSDNMGLVAAYRKQNARCPYLYSVILAIIKFARSINAVVSIEHINRCLTDNALIADLLSKGMLQKAWRMFPRSCHLGGLSLKLLKCLRNPFPTRVLGDAMAREIAQISETLEFGTECEDAINDLLCLPKC